MAERDLTAPWEQFPTFEPGSLGFRMGDGEDFFWTWQQFWDALTPAERASYLDRHAAPPDWREFIAAWEKL